MKITKKAFIENMTNNTSIFCGLTKRLFTKDEVFCAIQNLFESGAIVEQRTCEAKSNCIAFSGGSHLYFDQKAKYSFYEYQYAKGNVYICSYEWYDDFDEKYYTKAMYYLVKNA